MKLLKTIIFILCILIIPLQSHGKMVLEWEKVWEEDTATPDSTSSTTSSSTTAAPDFTDVITGMEFVEVKGGCYQMGDTFGDGMANENPVHEVCVSDFVMGRYEVTQSQYEKIMSVNPSNFKNGDHYPVEQVSWDDTQSFIKKLNAQTGTTYRLPTEAEWEYAARSGGKKEKYAGSNVDDVAWYANNSDGQTHPVGTKKPNGLGIYDMSGNVFEWCQDWFDVFYYHTSPAYNPQGPSSGSDRVLRGGGWSFESLRVRVAFRLGIVPEAHFRDLGFRLVLSSGQSGD